MTSGNAGLDTFCVPDILSRDHRSRVARAVVPAGGGPELSRLIGDRVGEGLILCGLPASGDGERLAVRRCSERRRANIR